MVEVVHPDFEPVVSALRWCVPRSGPGGAAVCVVHRGEVVVDVALGTRNAAGDPFTQDTLTLGFSTSKGVTATLMHVLVDRGILDLDRRVSDYWPEFAQAGKREITVRQVAAHQAGLYRIKPLLAHPEQIFDWDAVTCAIAAAAPAHEPGANFGYHAWTFGWIVGEILQRATGEHFSALLERYLAKPLGLDGLHIGLPEDEAHRAADWQVPASATPSEPPPSGPPSVRPSPALRAVGGIMRVARLNTDMGDLLQSIAPEGILGVDLNDPRMRSSVIPSVNGMFNARSLATLYGALACGGRAGDVQLLSAQRIAEATADQNRGVGRVIPFPLRIKLGYHHPFSFGVRGRLLGRQLSLGVANPDAFGHFGFGGCGAWADPERELGVALVTNCLFGRLPLDTRTVAINTAAGYCADRHRAA